jgi:hypothetical protein
MKIPNTMLLIVAALYALEAVGSGYVEEIDMMMLNPRVVWLL